MCVDENEIECAREEEKAWCGVCSSRQCGYGEATTSGGGVDDIRCDIVFFYFGAVECTENTECTEQDAA